MLRGGPWRYELIFVNDGSTDGTAARLEAIQRADPEHVRVAFLRRNCGQTAALSAALDLARGEVLIPMDGDRQNDPADIPRLLEGARRRLRRRLGLAEGPPGRPGLAQGPLVDRQPPGRPALGRPAARLRLHAQGLPPPRARRRAALRRDAPLHPDLRGLAGRAGHRAGGQPSPPHRRPDQVRAGPHLQRRPRPDPDPVLPALLAAAPALLRPVRALVVRPEHRLLPGHALLQVHLPLALPVVGPRQAGQDLRRDPPALADGHVLPGRRS